MPATHVATTGTPAAIASISTTGRPSAKLLITNKSACFSKARTCVCDEGVGSMSPLPGSHHCPRRKPISARLVDTYRVRYCSRTAITRHRCLESPSLHASWIHTCQGAECYHIRSNPGQGLRRCSGRRLWRGGRTRSPTSDRSRFASAGTRGWTVQRTWICLPLVDHQCDTTADWPVGPPVIAGTIDPDR
jgi:hypothetical protein